MFPVVSFSFGLSGPPAHCISTPGSRSIVDLGPGCFAMGPGALLFFLHLRLLLSVLSSSCLFLSALVLSCPGDVKRDPSYPPLVGSPSLPTPSWIGRMAIRQEGGGGDSFSTLWVW